MLSVSCFSPLICRVSTGTMTVVFAIHDHTMYDGGDRTVSRPGSNPATVTSHSHLVSMPGEVKDPTSPHWNV